MPVKWEKLCQVIPDKPSFPSGWFQGELRDHSDAKCDLPNLGADRFLSILDAFPSMRLG